MKRIAFVIAFFLCIGALSAEAQPTSQDSTCGVLRPRRETYIIVPYPSPAKHGQTMSIQYYNHNPEQTSLSIVDVNDRPIVELQPKQLMQNGIHAFDFRTNTVASGVYSIRLTEYTSDGSKLQVQDSRFIVAH